MSGNAVGYRVRPARKCRIETVSTGSRARVAGVLLVDAMVEAPLQIEAGAQARGAHLVGMHVVSSDAVSAAAQSAIAADGDRRKMRVVYLGRKARRLAQFRNRIVWYRARVAIARKPIAEVEYGARGKIVDVVQRCPAADAVACCERRCGVAELVLPQRGTAARRHAQEHPLPVVERMISANQECIVVVRRGARVSVVLNGGERRAGLVGVRIEADQLGRGRVLRAGRNSIPREGRPQKAVRAIRVAP